MNKEEAKRKAAEILCSESKDTDVDFSHRVGLALALLGAEVLIVKKGDWVAGVGSQQLSAAELSLAFTDLSRKAQRESNDWEKKALGG